MTVLHHAQKAGVNPKMAAQDAYARKQYSRKHFSPAHRNAYLGALALGYAVRAVAPRRDREAASGTPFRVAGSAFRIARARGASVRITSEGRRCVESGSVVRWLKRAIRPLDSESPRRRDRRCLQGRGAAKASTFVRAMR